MTVTDVSEGVAEIQGRLRLSSDLLQRQSLSEPMYRSRHISAG
jgi:hypothetical protein